MFVTLTVILFTIDVKAVNCCFDNLHVSNLRFVLRTIAVALEKMPIFETIGENLSLFLCCIG